MNLLEEKHPSGLERGHLQEPRHRNYESDWLLKDKMEIYGPLGHDRNSHGEAHYRLSDRLDTVIGERQLTQLTVGAVYSVRISQSFIHDDDGIETRGAFTESVPRAGVSLLLLDEVAESR